MITVSQKWKDYCQNSRVFQVKGTLGTTEISTSDFMALSFSNSISEGRGISVGSVITSSVNATLNNFTDKFL